MRGVLQGLKPLLATCERAEAALTEAQLRELSSAAALAQAHALMQHTISAAHSALAATDARRAKLLAAEASLSALLHVRTPHRSFSDGPCAL